MTHAPNHILKIALAVSLAAIIVTPAAAQQRPSQRAERMPDDGRRNFRCSEGSLGVLVDTREEGFVAVVFPDKDVSYTLPVTPWTPGDPAQVSWSDGQRTLVWSPGVELRWKDGASERVCVNGVTRHDHG